MWQKNYFDAFHLDHGVICTAVVDHHYYFVPLGRELSVQFLQPASRNVGGLPACLVLERKASDIFETVWVLSLPDDYKGSALVILVARSPVIHCFLKLVQQNSRAGQKK